MASVLRRQARRRPNTTTVPSATHMCVDTWPASGTAHGADHAGRPELADVRSCFAHTLPHLQAVLTLGAWPYSCISCRNMFSRMAPPRLPGPLVDAGPANSAGSVAMYSCELTQKNIGPIKRPRSCLCMPDMNSEPRKSGGMTRTSCRD